MVTVADAAATGNDMFASRRTLTGNRGTLTLSLLGSTLESDEGAGQFLPRGNGGSPWYSWTAPASVRFFLVDTPSFNTAVQLLVDKSGGALNELERVEPVYGEGIPRCANVEAFCSVFLVVPRAKYAIQVTSTPPTLVSSTFSVNWSTSA
jgi:hypothetical protein